MMKKDYFKGKYLCYKCKKLYSWLEITNLHGLPICNYCEFNLFNEIKRHHHFWHSTPKYEVGMRILNQKRRGSFFPRLTDEEVPVRTIGIVKSVIDDPYVKYLDVDWYIQRDNAFIWDVKNIPVEFDDYLFPFDGYENNK